jgi:alpha-tubulin suppressor-like RCC1 family protein
LGSIITWFNSGNNKYQFYTTKKDLTVRLRAVMNYHHSVVLQTDGQAFSCGKNTTGQLGLGDCNERRFFDRIETTVKFICVAAGYESHSVAIAENGRWVRIVRM